MLDPGSPEKLMHPNGAVSNDHTARPLMPPFSDIAKETIESLGVVTDEFSDLAEVTQTHPMPESQQISQQTIDNLASKIFGESGLDSAKQMAATFDELSQKFTRGESGRPHSQLQGSAAKLVFGNNGRSVSRKAWGANSSKGSRLIKFLGGVDLSAEQETLVGIRKQIIRPVLDRIKNSTKPEDIGTYTLKEIQGLLSEINEVDVNANLSTLKLISFMSMADCLKNPDLLKALYRKLGQPETERDLMSSQYTGFFEAANLADQLRSDDIDVRRGTVSYLRAGNPYTRTRLLQFRESKESRAYNEECDRLEEACFTYVDLVNTQKWLQRIKARGEKFETMKEQGAVIIAGRIAVRASGIVSQSNEELSDARENMITQSNGDMEATEQAWRNAISAEDLIVASARGLLTHVTSLRLKMSQDAKDLLRGTLKQSIRDEYDIIKRQASDEKIRPEINRLTSEFDEIDKLYHLPGKKLRDRNPDLIPLARFLSDNLAKLSPEHEPLDQYTARDLAGLLKGVYWERTGKSSSTPEIIQKYLDDAKTLRSLSGQLEKLGINTSSKLLQSINLLDEMIDSGAFDDINEHPEYDELTNFIFSYISLRDGNKVDPDELEQAHVDEPSQAR